MHREVFPWGHAINWSWGAAWGQAGYGQIPYAYLESRELSDDFWCIQDTESNRYAAWQRVACPPTALA